MRKLTVALGLVVVMALGLAAIGERQPAWAATGDNLVLVWNEETLDAIRSLSFWPHSGCASPSGGTHGHL